MKMGPRLLACGLALLVIGWELRAGISQDEDAGKSAAQGVQELIESIKQEASPERSPLSPAQLAAASELSTQISAQEWLGPLAPIALSPFFGITCLSGLAIWSPDWLPGRNGLFASPVLQNQGIFWTFLVLTVLTSLPRLSKVSKPFAQSVDRLEAYASIITLILIRFMADSSGGNDAPGGLPGSEVALTAGVFGFSVDAILSLAAAVNVLVINSIKFFFEMLIWITPVPLIDAIFEVCNKAACGLLMTIYAFSPAIATILNLLLLAICLVMFRWVYRRVRFYRTLISEPILQRIFPTPTHALTVFPRESFGPFPAKVKLHLTRNDRGWHLLCWRWPLKPVQMLLPADSCRVIFERGYLCGSIEVQGTISGRLVTAWRNADQAKDLCQSLNFEWLEPASTPTRGEIKAEWA